MPIRCASSGCTRTKENSGLIFAHCHQCNTWWCSKHGTRGNRCPGCGHKYLDGASSGGGCFVTTATLSALGKDDQCSELKAFREFRDNWLVNQKDGKELIEKYYRIAPEIVWAIERHPDRKDIYTNLWKEDIYPCLLLIQQSHFEAAKDIYLRTMIDLKSQFLSEDV